MTARKKAAAKAASEPAATGEVKDAGTLEAAATSSTPVEPVAIKAGVPTYRTDLGEALPPQKPAGVE